MRVLVWLGRVIRAASIDQRILGSAAATILATADRTTAVATTCSELRERLSSATPSIADRRRLDELERDEAALVASLGLTAREIRDCAARLRSAEAELLAVRDELVEANRGLVHYAVRPYVAADFPVEDLAAEGFVGLLHAIDRFDWRRGTKFSTYAVPTILAAAEYAVATRAKGIRIPPHAFRLMRRTVRLQDEARRTGAKLTNEELANALDLPVKTIRTAQAACASYVSLDAPLAGTSLTLAHTLHDPRPDQTDLVFAGERATAVEAALATLSTKERSVVRLLFGLGAPGAEHTPADVARLLGISTWSAHTIKRRALEKLRRGRTRAILEHYA